MTHAWHIGVNLLGVAQLATCAGCGTLRVEERGKTRYLRSTYDPELRIVSVEPPCVRLARKGRPPEYAAPLERPKGEVGHG